MQFTYGLNYLNRTSIDIINGIPISEIEVLTPDGISSVYSKYVWTKAGIWTKDWIYTANI